MSVNLSEGKELEELFLPQQDLEKFDHLYLEVEIEAENAEFEGFDLNGDEFTNKGIVVRPGSSDIIINENIIHGMALPNESAGSELSYGILVYGDGGGGPNPPNGIEISEVEIYDVSGSAISLGQYTMEVEIVENYFHDINTVDIDGEEISVGIQSVFAGDLVIEGNNFENVRIGTNIALCDNCNVGSNEYENVDKLNYAIKDAEEKNS